METDILNNGNVKVTIPWSIKCSGGRKRIILPDVKDDNADAITVNIARGFCWQELIDNGEFRNATELANALGINLSYIARTIRLTRLSPQIIHLALFNALPKDVSLEVLYQCSSQLWEEQNIILNITS